MTSPPPYDYYALPPVPTPPEQPERSRRRWVFAVIVAVWGVVLGGAAVWSVRNDPPTVPEQRDIAAALPLVRQAGGLVVAAADGPGQVMEIGALTFDRDCAVTPVRSGVEASRDVVLRVRDNEAPAVLEGVAAKLPAAYRPVVEHNSGETRFALRADAGDFVGVDASVRETDTTVTVRISTGCRPVSDGVDFAPAAVPATQEPDAFRDALAALGANPADAADPADPASPADPADPASPADPADPASSAGPGGGSGGATVVEVACPGGVATARTVVADGLKAPADLGRALREVTGGAVVVRAAADEWAYRQGAVSVVVTAADGAARVSATTGCA